MERQTKSRMKLENNNSHHHDDTNNMDDGLSSLLTEQEEKMNPADFTTYLPWACQQLSIDCILDIAKVAQVESKGRTNVLRNKNKEKKGDSTDKAGFSTFSLDAVHTSRLDQSLLVHIITTYSGDNLTSIKIDKTRHIPRKLLAIMALIIPFYPYLYGISINSGTDKYTIHEVCKILEASNITEISMDNTWIKEGYYDTILDSAKQLKVLSLARCRLEDEVIGKIASKIQYDMSPKGLTVLNLSTNRLTDKGAKYIAKMLRTNRRLHYLNLAGNMLTENGVNEILDVLYKFPLTIEETLFIKKKYLNFLKRRQIAIDDNMNKLREVELMKKIKKQLPKKSLKNEKKPSVCDLARSSSVALNKDKENMLYEKAVQMADLMYEAFNDPLGSDTCTEDGLLHSNGNNTLAYLNIAYNNISQNTVKKILKVLKYQSSLKPRNPRGLVNVCLEGNPVPKDTPELLEIDNILESNFTSKERASCCLGSRGKNKANWTK